MSARIPAHQASPRRGFTLVELLVVIAIIGILIAMLLPAVQAAREAARAVQCKNNMRQIGLALQNYHDAHGVLPYGFRARFGDAWSGYILPFVERGDLYDGMVFDQIASDPVMQWAYPGSTADTSIQNRKIIACQTVIPTYRCPSAPIPAHVSDRTFNGWVVPKRVPTTYLGSASGVLTDDEYTFSSAMGVPVMSSAEWGSMKGLDGVLFSDSEIKIRNISDGTSHTLLCGEALPTVQDNTTPETWGNRRKDHWSVGSDDAKSQDGHDGSELCGSTGVAMNPDILSGATVVTPEAELAYGSAHPGGCNMLFCDGSVRFIEESISPKIWAALATRAGGEVIPGDFDK